MTKEETRAYHRAWSARNKESILARGKIYREANREATKARTDAWRTAYPERQKRAEENYRLNNPEKRKASCKKYREANREAEKAYARAYASEHRAESAARAAARRSLKKNACPKWANAESIEAIYQFARLATTTLGETYHVDHVIPLKSSIVCGLHVETNLLVIPKSENLSKGNRRWPDMP